MRIKRITDRKELGEVRRARGKVEAQGGQAWRGSCGRGCSPETVASGPCLTQVNLGKHFPSLHLDFLIGKIREVAAECSSTPSEIRVPLPHSHLDSQC